MRMRMIEPDDVESAVSRLTSRIDVAFRREKKSIGIVGNILDADRFDDFGVRAEQDAAALGRQCVTRVRGNLVQHGVLDADDYNASTTIAMPIPPPMQSDATP